MAIPTLDIPLGHLYSKTPYPQVEYSPEQEEMVNLLVNREQYAQDRQAQEAAALTAKVNIDKIRPELQGLALRDISKHEKDLRSLYGDKMNRKNLYNLNTEGKAKVSLANTALLGRIGALEQFTKDAAEADKRYYALLAKGDAGFTMEDYHAVRKEWEDRVKAANSVDDVPWLSQLTQERIEPKVKQANLVKEATQLQGLRDKLIAAGNQGQDNQTSWDEDKAVRITNTIATPQEIQLAFGDQKTYLQALKDSWKKKTPTPPNWLQINNAQSKNVPIDPVINPDIDGKTFPLNSIPVPYSTQISYTDDTGKKRTTAAKGEITQIDRTPSEMTAVINLKYKKSDSYGNTEDAVDVKQEPVTPDLISKLTRLGYDTRLLKQEYDDFVKNKNKSGSISKEIDQIPDVTYTSSKKSGTFSRKALIKKFVDVNNRIPTKEEWNEIVIGYGLKPKK